MRRGRRATRLEPMNSHLFLDSLPGWARRACGLQAQEPTIADDPHLYSLRAWPELPEEQRTAAVYRLLSVMTVRAVPRLWMARQSGLDAAALDTLLLWLERDGVLVRGTLRSQAGTAQPRAAARAPGSEDLLALV